MIDADDSRCEKIEYVSAYQAISSEKLVEAYLAVFASPDKIGLPSAATHFVELLVEKL